MNQLKFEKINLDIESFNEYNPNQPFLPLDDSIHENKEIT